MIKYRAPIELHATACGVCMVNHKRLRIYDYRQETLQFWGVAMVSMPVASSSSRCVRIAIFHCVQICNWASLKIYSTPLRYETIVKLDFGLYEWLYLLPWLERKGMYPFVEFICCETTTRNTMQSPNKANCVTNTMHIEHVHTA